MMMETGSFKVIGGAAKDTYSLYKRLRASRSLKIDIFGAFSKIDSKSAAISYSDVMATDYDVIWLNSIRDVGIVESYRRSHPSSKAKFIYVDRGNVLLNFKKTGIKRLLPKMLARMYLMRRMREWLDAYIAISAEQEPVARMFFKKSTQIANITIAPHDEYRPTGKRRTFNGGLSVSRLDERQKKISLMIRGIAKVKASHPELKDAVLLKIVGTGKDEENYKALSKSLGVQRNIVFAGFMTGKVLITAYNNAAFFVSTSEWEGLGRSLLEAMACGLPLLINNNINTAIKSNPTTRVVREGYNGMLYDYGDIDGFAEKFYTLYSNRTLQKKLSGNAIRFVSGFSFARIVESYRKLLLSL